MPRHLPATLLLLFTAFGQLTAQGQEAKGEESPWLFLEASPYLIDQSIQFGREYTSPGFSYGYDTRVMATRQLGSRVALQIGLGIGTRKFQQDSRYGQWWQVQSGRLPVSDPDRFDRVYLNQTYLEIPLRIRAEVLQIGSGALYLRGGTSWKLPLIQSVETYGVSEVSGGTSRIPDEEVSRKMTHLLTAGLGYLVKDANGYRWYLELHFGGSTGTVFDQEVKRGGVREQVYLRSSRIREFGIVGGLGF